jgi:hypothetical protein
MDRRALPFLLVVSLAAGCVSDGAGTLLVSDSPFGAPVLTPQATQTTFAPATTEIAARVDLLGRNLVAANSEIGARPLFRTIGAPQPEIFHRGTAEIYISEGLVKQCAGDGQLAALLCHELGQMVSEREAVAAPRAWQAPLEPPPEVRVGNDNGGLSAAPDLTRQAELAKYRPPGRRQSPPPPPDPDALARGYLQKAGYAVTDLDAAAPLFRAAAANATLEKQVITPGPQRPWTTQ